MKRITVLALVMFALAGCGQSQEPAASQAAATDAGPAAQSTPASTAPAAQSTPASTAPAPAARESEAVAAATAPAESTDERIQLAQADFSAVEAAGFVEGRHYRRLSPTQPTTTSPDTVEVDEFFMHSCIHCYNLEPYVQAWLPEKPDYIEFVRVPTTWNPTVKLHAQAFYAAQALGKEEEMHLPFFREMHERQNYLQSPEALADFFGQFGVSKDEFESVFDSFSVMTKVNRAQELGTRYRVDSTPTIIVNGKYRTGVDMAGGYDQLFQLIELLALAELGQ